LQLQLLGMGEERNEFSVFVCALEEMVEDVCVLEGRNGKSREEASFFSAAFGIDKYSCWINGMSGVSVTERVSPEHFNLLLSSS